ncbi:MAG: sigma-54-dependent Fis family transcriptional regulator [Halioglobus sp.]|nr:sigma-54-dependent Fis family transcriptional regulator [Halioglobus sp.]
MRKPRDGDLTLPSVRAAEEGAGAEEQLLLTIVYHADASRIGEWSTVTEVSGPIPWILGRHSPDFQREPGAAGSPIDDPHVSRRALRFDYRAGVLTLSVEEGASRCLAGARELKGTVELGPTALAAGIPLLLGHGTVLLLRLGALPAAQGDGELAQLLLGNSAAMRTLRERVLRAGGSDLDVLLRGETGTGKELAATAIHRASRRAQAELVCVNMAAIAPELAAAALFGAARGAYTGADKARAGFFQQARGGTLFLDEIGDAASAVQPQLLRALQEREVQPVGGAIEKIDLRIVSATDADLERDDGDFNSALLYRLGALELELPPLREHPEDIGLLLAHFLREAARAAGLGDPLPTPASDAIEIAGWARLFYHFLRYAWPGNVRELANAAQQVLVEGGDMPALPRKIKEALYSAADEAEPVTQSRRMRDIDEATFDAAMASCAFEARRVALKLGVSRTSVYRRIEASPRFRLVVDIPERELQRALECHGGDCAATAAQLEVAESSLRTRLKKLGAQ